MQETTGDQAVPLTSIKKLSGKSHVELVLRDSVKRSRTHCIEDVSPHEQTKVRGYDCIRCRVWIQISTTLRESHSLLCRIPHSLLWWRWNLWWGEVHRFSSDLFRRARDWFSTNRPCDANRLQILCVRANRVRAQRGSRPLVFAAVHLGVMSPRRAHRQSPRCGQWSRQFHG